MYYLEDFTPPKEKITKWKLRGKAEQFKEANTLPNLAILLNKSLPNLKNVVNNRHYAQFYVPKPNGDKRLIETPSKELKKVLQKLNDYLQAVYHGIKPACAYGCILSTADEKKKKNIYTNALQHIGQKWLFSVDLENFFNNISYLQVRQVFRQAPFNCNENTTKLLADLTTYENRLPIGSPTSPVLSNLICLPLDKILTKFAKKNDLTYTRYLDDFSFSANGKIKKSTIKSIVKQIIQHGFFPNMEKTVLNKVSFNTLITGLSISKSKPDVSRFFMKNLKSDVKFFHKITSPEMLSRNIFPAEIALNFRNSILGKLNFLQFIRGEGDAEYVKLKRKLQGMPVF